MRVQCSLIINDDEVYEAIQDLKEQRELNNTLASLITRWVKDENFRNALSTEAEYVAEGDVSMDNVYAETYENLAAMDIILKDAENVFSSGKSSLEECMEQAENIGVMRRNVDEETGTVSQVSLIEVKKQFIKEEEAGDSDMLDIGLIAQKLQQVTSRVDTLMSDIAELKSKGIIPTHTEEEKSEPEPVEQFEEDDFEFDTPTEEVQVEPEPVVEVQEDVEESITFIPEEPEETEEKDDQPVLGEATGDIGNFLSSLY